LIQKGIPAQNRGTAEELRVSYLESSSPTCRRFEIQVSGG
jgi:hypothetical protein